MRTPVDLRLLEEAQRFQLRFSCESCAHYEPSAGGCANGYPNHDHRARELNAGEWLIFCKEFELSG